MKRLLPIAAAAFVALSAMVPRGDAQNAAATAEQQQIVRAVKELQEQQAAIAQNEAKIEEKLAAVAEAVRQARIFANRAGGQR